MTSSNGLKSVVSDYGEPVRLAPRKPLHLSDCIDKIELSKDKLVLDACCGGRMFWFDKKNPIVLFQDIRQEKKGFIRLRPSYEVNPDVVMDYRSMNHKDQSFYHVVWDPSHLLQAGKNGWQAQKFGVLNKETWREDLSKGFLENWRVLKDYGTLIFKWNEAQVPLKEVLTLFPVQPLYGHTTGRSGKTIWLAFFKNPKLTEVRHSSQD